MAKQLSTTMGSVLLINANDPNDKLEVQFAPQEIETTRVNKTEEVSIVGRNLPFYQGVSGARKIDLTLEFYTEAEDGKDIHQKVAWIESFTFNETFQESRPSLFIVFGENFVGSRFIIEGDVKTTFADFDAQYNFAPRRATVKITLCQEFSGSDLKRSDWRNGNF